MSIIRKTLLGLLFCILSLISIITIAFINMEGYSLLAKRLDLFGISRIGFLLDGRTVSENFLGMNDSIISLIIIVLLGLFTVLMFNYIMSNYIFRAKKYLTPIFFLTGFILITLFITFDANDKTIYSEVYYFIIFLISVIYYSIKAYFERLKESKEQIDLPINSRTDKIIRALIFSVLSSMVGAGIIYFSGSVLACIIKIFNLISLFNNNTIDSVNFTAYAFMTVEAISIILTIFVLFKYIFKKKTFLMPLFFLTGIVIYLLLGDCVHFGDNILDIYMNCDYEQYHSLAIYVICLVISLICCGIGALIKRVKYDKEKSISESL